MRLLISTHSGLFLFNRTREEATLSQLAAGYYYGIAIYPSYALVARRIDPWSSKESPTAFEKWSLDGRGLGTVNMPGEEITDVHEMALGRHGLYICNLGHDTLEIRDPETLEITQVLEFMEDRLPGGRAINSVFTDGDDVWCNFHNRGIESYIHEMKHVEGELVWCRRHNLPAKGSHSIFVDSDFIYYNDSDCGGVTRIGRDGGITEDWDKKGTVIIETVTIDKSMHTKGMAYLPETDQLVVGISQKGTLKDRFCSESHLVFMNKSDFKPTHTYALIDPVGRTVGNINEIRSI